ncbi:DNA mismatch repair endonuclease MutL [Planctomicrobium piriforme]|uniref:DNA mismatch repair protein MutL n=1 Tax=Planctomicrobium piriforme TaxID=1576369 RepID=A0A1I3BBV8_9PLAN|nr:DNA mismatch repair endonuclease MutL [Planctomicrobium piriforme]SFH59762.1 DNA mismatch repair protein MutL [Planctomicrobium piriforme]
MHTDVTSRIRQLPTSVINKIAAGEVIERPASVVKELLENCVDALATRIDVDVEQGGAELIRITDNGEGIHPDDVELTVASHATSKLVDADDLFSVKTMGFRGEALASVAEISHFRLRTKQRDQLMGVELEVHGGIVKEPRACGAPDGTQIEVRQLFFNTPVRRKFLKTASTEFAHIAEQFTRIALANPGLQMTLRHNGRCVHELPPTHQLIERIELFFGGEVAQHLISVEAEHAGARIWGFVAHPSQNKSTRKGQYLFLNGRWIQDRSLQHALGEAYRGLVMVGRYPVAFLFLELPPDQVDVNVHPTKSEVRFQDSQTLYRLLLSTIRNRFLSMDLDSRLSVGAAPSLELSSEPPARQEVQRELVSWATAELQRQADAGWSAPPPVPASPATSAASDDEFDRLLAPPSMSPSAPVAYATTAEAAITPASASAEVRAMQVHDCYLVVETTEGITVIDQHALHERIMYEQLRRRVLSGGVEVQRLLIPITVSLTGREAGILLDQIELLEELGLQVQDFGGNTIALTGYPTLMAKADPQSLVKDIVDLLESTGRKVERRDLLDSLLHMMSCKAAIKAGQRLSFEEMEALLAQRHLCDDAHHCPHGRPTALKLSRDELDRQFGRLGS